MIMKESEPVLLRGCGRTRPPQHMSTHVGMNQVTRQNVSPLPSVSHSEFLTCLKDKIAQLSRSETFISTPNEALSDGPTEKTKLEATKDSGLLSLCLSELSDAEISAYRETGKEPEEIALEGHETSAAKDEAIYAPAHEEPVQEPDLSCWSPELPTDANSEPLGQNRNTTSQSALPYTRETEHNPLTNCNFDMESQEEGLSLTAEDEEQGRESVAASRSEDVLGFLGNEGARSIPVILEEAPMLVSADGQKTSNVPHVDDAEYLHAFLTRAKAKKAARGPSSPEKLVPVPPSPMTRSRAALAQLSTNSPSPKKAKKSQSNVDFSETNVGETAPESKASSPFRRSGRTRLPRPQRGPVTAPTATPSTIPLRRSNGTEFVFLQRADAQEIALTTRTNTKRNKGEAVMPKMKLQALLEESPKSPSKSPRKSANKKEVSWNDELAYFGAEQEKMVVQQREEQDTESQPKTRKIRRLGAANGTPAPKKVMAESTVEMGTPLPKRRGKARS